MAAMTPETTAALRRKETATRRLQDALTPYEDGAGFAHLWTLVREYGAACTALGAQTAIDAVSATATRRPLGARRPEAA